MRILIMGLPGSGKSTLAELLEEAFRKAGKTTAHFNANKVREQFDDWDFSPTGRIRQAHRMKHLADNIPSGAEFAICDFIAPLPEMRTIFNANFTIWMDTITEGRYPDTNALFIPPTECDYRVTMNNRIDAADRIVAKILYNE